jgi:hypothetical protein
MMVAVYHYLRGMMQPANREPAAISNGVNNGKR